MSPHRLAPALAGVVLCSLLAGGCGQNKVPSQSEARDDVHDQLVAQGVPDADAGEVADCVSSGLFESGDFTKEERDATLRATDGDPPDPELTTKVTDLVDGCADDAGVDVPNTAAVAGGGDASSSTTTTTEG
jgi:hypothetical protein